MNVKNGRIRNYKNKMRGIYTGTKAGSGINPCLDSSRLLKVEPLSPSFVVKSPNVELRRFQA